jgi:hypothetical protein
MYVLTWKSNISVAEADKILGSGVDMHGCKTRSFIIKEELRLNVFETWATIRIFQHQGMN